MPFIPYRVLLNCPKESVNRVAFSSDTRFLASGGDDGCLCIHAFRLPSSYPLKAEYPGAITSLKWIPGAHRLFVGLSCGSVHLLDVVEVRLSPLNLPRLFSVLPYFYRQSGD